jgi:hypothetical protein
VENKELGGKTEELGWKGRTGLELRNRESRNRVELRISVET